MIPVYIEKGGILKAGCVVIGNPVHGETVSEYGDSAAARIIEMVEGAAAKKGGRKILYFGGVDSAFFVYLNGEYVGYNQISHSTSEFDVTEKLVEGKNRLAVLVLKWCDGSYLEDQDKFRTSGIFRDVYLIKRPKNCVRDYFVTNSLSEENASIRIRMAYNGEFTDTKCKLYDSDNNLICQANAESLENGGASQ